MKISYRNNGVYRCVRGSTAIAGIKPLEKTLGPWETNDESWSWSALPTAQRKRLLAPPQTRPHHGQTAAHWVCLCGAQAPDRESQSQIGRASCRERVGSAGRAGAWIEQGV